MTSRPIQQQAAVSPQEARRILVALIFPGIMMPFLNSISWVALPVIRDAFQIQADMTAWVATVFTLPFMILTPVYGRLSDGLGKRRLILAGSIIFSAGTIITVLAPGLTWLMVGRAVQGLGTAGMMPLAMAFITTIFQPGTRGKALGAWSVTGPTTAFLGPLIAGFLIDGWGWRVAIAPPLLVSVLAFVVIYRWVPAGLSIVRPGFLKRFDWAGVVLLAGCLTSLLFYLSSRPITGVPPLQDGRLFAITAFLAALFLAWESRRRDPFVSFDILRNRTFSLAAFCAAMRMSTMAGMGFLIPLYLADVRGLSAARIGLLMMTAPGSMIIMVFFGGRLSDSWGSRWPTFIGLSVQGTIAVSFFLLPATVPLSVIVLILACYGLGSGFSLAALHWAALDGVPEAQMGAAAGLYGMLRFFGGVLGTALGGVILQRFLDQALPVLSAYQYAFLFFAGTVFIGALAGLRLRGQNPRPVFAKTAANPSS